MTMVSTAHVSKQAGVKFWPQGEKAIECNPNFVTRMYTYVLPSRVEICARPSHWADSVGSHFHTCRCPHLVADQSFKMAYSMFICMQYRLYSLSTSHSLLSIPRTRLWPQPLRCTMPHHRGAIPERCLNIGSLQVFLPLLPLWKQV